MIPDSPLAEIASIILPNGAGPEKSAAATKSFITSLSAIAQMVALWSGDAAMQAALSQLPSALAQAWREDWSPCRDKLQTADHLYTVGRGLHLAIAQEAAHKLKETCMIHAEAYQQRRGVARAERTRRQRFSSASLPIRGCN